MAVTDRQFQSNTLSRRAMKSCVSVSYAQWNFQLMDPILIIFAVADVGQEGIVEAESEALRDHA